VKVGSVEREPIDWKARQGARKAVSFRGSVKVPGGREVAALITNMSYSGCQVLAETKLVVGDTIQLSIAGRGSMEAQVRWTAGDSAGLQFLLGQSQVEERRARIGV
jgi:hypothetical protein